MTQSYSENDYINNGVAPGDYVFTFDVSTDPGNAALTEQFTFTVTLIDPCNPPNSITSAAFTNQQITVTQDDYPDYTHPGFVVDPSYCPITLSYDIASITGVNNVGKSAIT